MFIRICFLFCFFFSFSLYVDGQVGPGNEGGISNESGAEEGVTAFGQCDSEEFSKVSEACSPSTLGQMLNTVGQAGSYLATGFATIKGDDTLAHNIAGGAMIGSAINTGAAIKCGAKILLFQNTCRNKKEEHEQAIEALEQIKKNNDDIAVNETTIQKNEEKIGRGSFDSDRTSLQEKNKKLATKNENLTSESTDLINSNKPLNGNLLLMDSNQGNSEIEKLKPTLLAQIDEFDAHYAAAQKEADYVDKAALQAQSYMHVAQGAHAASENLKGNNSGDKKDGPKEPKVLNFSPNTPLGQNQVLGQAHPGRKATPISPFAGGLGAKDPKAEAKGEGKPEQVAQEEKEEMDLNPLSGGSSKKASGLASFAGGHLRSLESSRQLAAQDQKASKSDEETDEESSLDTKPFGSFVGGSNSSRKNSYNSPASKKKYFNKKLAKLTLKKNTKVAQLSGVQKKGVSRNKVKSIFDQMSMTIVSYCSKGHSCRGM